MKKISLSKLQHPKHLPSTPTDFAQFINSLIDDYNRKISEDNLSHTDLKNYEHEQDELLLFIEFTSQPQLKTIWSKITPLLEKQYGKDSLTYNQWLLIKYYIAYLKDHSDWDELSSSSREDELRQIAHDLRHISGKFERFGFRTKSGWYWNEDDFEVLSRTSNLSLDSLPVAKMLCGPSIPDFLNRLADDINEHKSHSIGSAPYINRVSSNPETNRFRAFINKVARRNQMMLGKPYPSLISDIASHFFHEENTSPDKIRLSLKPKGK